MTIYAMQIFKRPFFIKLGRVEVYAEAWQHFKGEPLIQHQKSIGPFASESQWWMPGLHLIVSRCHPASSSVEV